MSSKRTNDIEALSEQLGSLQITEETSDDYERSDIEMSVASVPAAINENIQVLWQPLDQCPIAVQAVNLKGRYLVGNMSCVFTRELDREPQ